MATRRWISTSSTDWATAGNWSGSAVPADGDDVVIDGILGTADIDTNLGQSTIQLASLRIDQSYTGKIGTTSAYLVIGASTVTIGLATAATTTPAGSPRIKLDLRDALPTAAAVTVHNSCATATEASLPPIRLLTPAGSNLTVRKGRVGVAVEPGETSTVVALNVGYVSNQDSDATVILGSGVTLTNVDKSGGTLVLHCDSTDILQTAGTLEVYAPAVCGTVTVAGGTATLNGTGAISELYVKGGTVYSNTTGDVAATYLSGGVCDLTQSNTPREFTAVTVYPAAALRVDKNIFELGAWLDDLELSGSMQLTFTGV